MKTIITTELDTPAGHRTIGFPLDTGELEKCMAEAGILTGSHSEYKIESVESIFSSLKAILASASDIHELNYLAVKLNTFDEYDAQGFADIHAAMGGGMHNAINLATHYNKDLALYSDICDLYTLGLEFIKSNLSADVSKYSDFQVVELGKHAQQVMRGLFIADQDMYVGFPPEYSKRKYDGHILPYDNLDSKHTIYMYRTYSIPKVKIKNGLVSVNDCIDGEACIPIRIRSGAITVSHALERIGARNLTDRVTYRYKPNDHFRSKIKSSSFGFICKTADTMSRMTDEQIASFDKALDKAIFEYSREAVSKGFGSMIVPMDEIIYSVLTPYLNTKIMPDSYQNKIEIITGEADVQGSFKLHTVSISDAAKLLSSPGSCYVRACGASAYAYDLEALISQYKEAERGGFSEKTSVLEQIKAAQKAPKLTSKPKHEHGKKTQGEEL